MGFFLSAGVYTSERDLSDIIPAVATSIGVVCGEFQDGPVDKPTLVTSQEQSVNKMGEPWAGSYAPYVALQFLEEANMLYLIRPRGSSLYGGIYADYNGATTAAVDGIGTGVANPEAVGDAPAAEELFKLYYRNPGADSTRYSVAIVNYLDWAGCDATVGVQTDHTALRDHIKADIEDQPDDTSQFVILVYDHVNNEYVESHLVSRNITAKNEKRQSIYLENVINGGVTAPNISGGSDFLWAVDSALSPATYPFPISSFIDSTALTGLVKLTGGTDTTSLTSGQINAGYELIRNPEEFNVNIILGSGHSAEAINNKMIAIAENRKDCISVCDPPFAQDDPTTIVDWKRNTWNPNSSYGCLYWPWIKVYDRYTDQQRWIPPSGFAGAAMAFTDFVDEPWMAPAGFNRGLIIALDLQYNSTLGERDLLYMNNINPLVAFPGHGTVIWGQKTLQSKASALNRINVRRLMLVLEKAVATYGRYLVFEPNDRFTRKRVVHALDSYLADVRQRRGLYWFGIVCDDKNNTPARIDRNELWIDIYLQPTKAAEIIKIRFNLLRTGASVEELV